jgi:hypothetical protein
MRLDFHGSFVSEMIQPSETGCNPSGETLPCKSDLILLSLTIIVG